MHEIGHDLHVSLQWKFILCSCLEFVFVFWWSPREGWSLWTSWGLELNSAGFYVAIFRGGFFFLWKTVKAATMYR